MGIGLGEAEIFGFQVGGIELVGDSGGGIGLCVGENCLMPMEMTYEWSSRRQGPS